MVIGAQGAGKTSIMKYLDNRYGFRRIHNEDLYVDLQKQHPDKIVVFDETLTGSIYQEAERKIRDSIGSSHVAYESTGAKMQWRALYKQLNDLSPVVVIVECPFELALKRHQLEDKAGKYIAPDPDAHAKELYKQLLTAEIQPDFCIDNSGSQENTEDQVDALMQQLGLL